MNTEAQKHQTIDLRDRLQSGELVIGLSSAIPGFIKENPARKAISFAPFYVRDKWVDLPIAIIQEIPQEPKLPLSFSLKPGSRKEKVLIDIIGALANTVPMRAGGNGSLRKDAATAECGACSRCAVGDEYCVDCYLFDA